MSENLLIGFPAALLGCKWKVSRFKIRDKVTSDLKAHIIHIPLGAGYLRRGGAGGGDGSIF